MVKTRSQTGAITIKKEEEDCKPTHILNGVSNTAKKRDRITKRKPPKNKNNLPVQQVKVEEDTDIKSLLHSTSKSSKLTTGQRVSQKQINQLIDYVVNDKLSVYTASDKANMSVSTAYYYYNLYKNDSKKRIPSPRNKLSVYTQEHIENLIRYIVDDKMTVPQASAKANMTHGSGKYYYNKYLTDPKLNTLVSPSRHHYTQERKNEFIGYIVNDKMSIVEASIKAKMGANSGYMYYHKYFNGRNPDIATPSHIASCKRHTQEQKEEVVGYIVNDKMSISAAAEKVNMKRQSAARYYQQYLKDPSNDVPTPPNHITSSERYTQKQINQVISYIVDDNMSIKAASRKANIHCSSGYRHYRQYLRDHNMEIPVPRNKKPYTQDEINELIGYIVDDKMSIKAASKKMNMSDVAGLKYYHQYLDNQKRD